MAEASTITINQASVLTLWGAVVAGYLALTALLP